MYKITWKHLLVSPIALGFALAASSVATAQVSENGGMLNQLEQYGKEGQGQTNSNSIDQVTSVSQLRDVSPGDWAFEALRNLVERYGCIAGYPNRTFRGNQPLTRYEFAAGLNACLQQIERLIPAGRRGISDADLAQINRLVQEFQAELATLGTRVDNLEARTDTLEENQFSTTTKLEGEVIFALTDTFGDNNSTQAVFGDRVRLVLNTSFTGKDKLITRLAAGNLSAFSLDGTGFVNAETTQTFNLSPGNNNNVAVDWAAYYLPIGRAQLYLGAAGGIHSDYAVTNNPYFEDYDGGNGALSTFASQSPIFRIGGGAGAALNFKFGQEGSFLDGSKVTAGYLAGPDAADPSDGNGLFNGEYSTLGQVSLNLGDRLGLGLTYVHAYHSAGNDIFDAGAGEGGRVVGTQLANNPGLVLGDAPMVSNSYGIEAAWRISERISLSGYGAYTSVISIGKGSDDVWTYGGGFAFPDLGKEGSVLGIFGGVQPYLGSVQKNPIHVEAFYKYKLSDNISLTPGVIWLHNPAGGALIDNKDAFVGTLRTTFTF